MMGGRFEVRSARGRSLHGTFARFEEATRFADELLAELGLRCVVVDSFLDDEGGRDDRVVWRHPGAKPLENRGQEEKDEDP